ncbi:ParB N-terminal domain-containing protein [Polynucleobacter sp. 78F-HAINBA]|uniref:site-specific DNA-methyltransferase n=1 Tax=Polynucleobacter sp. 78F-HAINBA TaxID=2689099 RepID=UPI001C0C31F0|nr:DNA methyltransferase [Polynucleobacter sp. 78F-HAINBA]MBU3591196.1 ParB N-terminal domain-containing protein [Polynucleobacter sp. 78F-HAINBA]
MNQKYQTKPYQPTLHSPKASSIHKDIKLEIRYALISELIADSRNPRIHSKHQIKQIAKAIQASQIVVPIFIDPSGKILAGHGRLLAAQYLGLDSVPVICVSHLTPEQAILFAISDNKLTENARWDDNTLGKLFAELSRLEVNLDLEISGFSTTEIDLKIADLDPIDPQENDPADFAIPVQKKPISKLGDVWLLDKHQIICGNSLEDGIYQILMRDCKANAVFSDAPYNVPISGHVGGGGKIQHREFRMASGKMSVTEFTQFLTAVFQLLSKYSTPTSIHFQCIDWRHLSEMLSAGSVAYAELINLAVWVKNSGGMGSLYRSRHELVLVFANHKGPRRNNVQLGKFGRNRTNVWEYPGILTMSKQSEEGNLLALHPTVKPVAMVADAILDITARNEIVLDPFLGSGTTLLACERTGRTCRGIEIDPLYLDTAIRRWQYFTGGSAIHAQSGQSFDELSNNLGG